MKYRILYLICFVSIIHLTSCKQDTAPSDAQVEEGSGDVELEVLTEAIAKDSDNPDLYFKRSQAFYQRGAFDRAIADMESAMQIDSLNPSYFHHLSDVYLDYYQSRKALQTMMVAKHYHPERLPTLLKLAETQYILKQYDESISTLNEIFYLKKEDAETFFMLGLNLREQGLVEEATNAFKEAVDRDPELIDAWLILGEMAERSEDPLAATYYDNAVRIDPNNISAKHSKAFYLQNNGDIPGAIDLYRDIVSIDREYSDAYLNMGILYMEQDSLDRAYEQFNIISNMEPANPFGHYYKAIAMEAKGDLTAALSSYKSAVALKPDFTKAEQAIRAINKKLKD